MRPPDPGRAGPRLHDSPLALLADSVAAAPDRVALRAGGFALTYAEYGRAVAGFARGLEQRGASGQVVTVALPNGVEIAVAMLAAQAAGATVNPVNPDYTARELSIVIADARPRLIVLKAELAGRVRASIPPDLDAELLVLPDDPAAWLATWAGDAALALPRPPDPDAVALLQYTGGTTGAPKGVELTHRQMAVNVTQREAALPTEDGERVLCMMPLFHSFATAMCLLLAAYCRGTLVILPRYRPDRVLDAVARERITLLPAGPAVFNGLLAYEGIESADLSSLRACYSGSAALPLDTLERWRARTGCTIFEGYGQTEAGPILTYGSPGQPLKPGGVGLPLPMTQVQIVDVETGRIVLPAGALGEIRARGPQIMRGYRDRPEETAAALRDGWLHTGDIGLLDEDGCLFVRDRKKEMVITGGFNVYPREVEEVLTGHPGVRLAAVIGVPDSYRGETLRAFVQREPADPPDEAALRAWCAERLVKYKRPSDLRFVDALPLTSANKIDKQALRALA